MSRKRFPINRNRRPKKEPEEGASHNSADALVNVAKCKDHGGDQQRQREAQTAGKNVQIMQQEAPVESLFANAGCDRGEGEPATLSPGCGKEVA